MPLQRALAGALASRYDLVVPERCVLSELASRYDLVVLGRCVLRELGLRGGVVGTATVTSMIMWPHSLHILMSLSYSALQCVHT